MQQKQTIGFIGIGAMGAPMIEHLLAAGFAVNIFARKPEAAQTLIEKGATLYNSIAKLAASVQVLCTNVTTGDDVQAIYNEALPQLSKGSLGLDFSTISPLSAKVIAAQCAAAGVEFLDCPVSGGAAGARAATLSMMIGGTAKAYEHALPILQHLGKTFVHCGPAGSGQVVKLCNQIAQVINIQGIAEATRFAESFGADTQKMLQCLQAGFAGSKMLDLMGPKMVAGDFSAAIQARLHHKDLVLANDLSTANGLNLPNLTQTTAQLNQLMANGWGFDDTSSLKKLL